MKKFIFFALLLTFFGEFLFPGSASAQSVYCSSAGPDGDITYATSGTRRTYAYGVGGSLGHLYFPTWTESGGQDDIVWYPGVNSGGGTWYADINLANHTAVGNIFVHVYVYNSSNEPTFCDYANFSRANYSSGPGVVHTIADGCIESAEAEIVSAIPANLTTGQTYNFQVRIRNTGTTWWYHGGWGWDSTAYYQFIQKSGGQSLSLYNDDLGSYANPPTAPSGYGGGAWGYRTFTLTAPSTPGNYSLTMQMHHGPFPDYIYQFWDGTQCGSVGGGSDSYQWFGNELTQNFTVSYASCSGTPWGTVAHGYSNTAYSASSPSGACVSETRTCSNGSMSGSYTQTSCSAGCTGTPWGNVVNGYSNTAYISSTADTCSSQTRTCSSGTLSGTYTATSCTVNSYSITFNSAGGSAVSTITQQYGTAISAPANPTRTGYTFTGWSPTLASTMPSGGQSLTATWSINSYTVSTSAGSGGSISPTSRSVSYGSNTTFTVTPDSGYSIASVTGCSGSLSGNTYTTGAITGNCTVSVTFSQNVPATPTGFWSGPSSCGNNWINLSWNASSYATSYQVYRNGSLVYNGSATSFSDTGLTIGASYSYTLTASNAAGSSAAASSGPTTVASYCSCAGTPWGTVAHGYSNTAYAESSPAGACTSQTRTCSNGTMSGIYTITSCSPGCASTPWGAVAHGYSNTAYSASTADVCQSQTRTCSSGTLSGTYTATSCTVNSYTYNFSGNGATTDSSPTSQTSNYGTAISAPTSPSRTGYAFTGWSPAIPGTMPSGGGTSYAQWSLNSYTVSTSAGTGGSISPTSRVVNHGSTGSFTITPNSGYVISSVTGCSGSLSGSTYTTGAVAQNCTVTATFSSISLSVSATTPIASNPSSSVSFSYTPTTSTGSTECRLLDYAQSALTSYQASSPILYTAPSSTGSYGYYIQCRNTTDTSVVSTSNQIILNLSGTLSVTKSGTGGGTVTSSPAGIDCGGTCSYVYAYNTSVTLTASPTTGSTFDGWSGACSGTGACSVTLSQARSVTATFNSGSYAISWTATNGSGSPTSCTYGATVNPTCTPDTGYSTVSCPSSFTCSTSNSKTATFGINTYTLTTTKSGTGSGTITSSPSGINCGATCSYGFNYNTSVTLTGTPSADSDFVGWSGDCNSGGVVTMSTSRSCTATFSLNPPSAPASLTATASTCGTGTINLSWPAVSGATSYQVYRNGGLIYSNTSTSYSDTGLSGSTAYTYTVRASNAGGQSGSTSTNPVQTTSPVATCNTPPNAPTISGQTSGYPDTSYTYTFTATDSQSDQIRYGIDWNMDGTADEWLPAGVSYVSSGTSRNTSYSWSTTGSKTFRALTQDFPGVNSGWTNYSVTISSAPVNGVCGTANRTYSVGSSSYGTDTYCSAGAQSSSPAFPAPGNSSTWVCNGLNDGANSGTCTATNPQAQHTITVSGTPQGTITTDDGGINCGSDCGGIYEEGTTIYLRAYPISSFWKFSGWSGLCTNQSYLCILEVEEPGVVTPNFEPRLFDYLEF